MTTTKKRKPTPSTLSPRIRAILERTRRALGGKSYPRVVRPTCRCERPESCRRCALTSAPSTRAESGDLDL